LKLFPFWVKPRWSLLRYHFENIQSPKSWLISDLPKSICSEVFSLYIDNIKKPSLICWQDIATKAEWNTWSLIRYFRASELLYYFKFFLSCMHEDYTFGKYLVCQMKQFCRNWRPGARPFQPQYAMQTTQLPCNFNQCR
jgi:hypothetical protein